jgi:FkbM family methyltransferase
MGSFKKYIKISRRIIRSLSFIRNHPIGRIYLPYCIWKYIKFHLIHSFIHKRLVYPYLLGVRFYCQPGDAGIVGNVFVGLEDFEEMGFLLHLLRKDDCFVDVGANVGSYSLLASGICHATSISFEPVPETFINLEQNILLNDLSKRITPIQKGVGSKTGIKNFSVEYGTMNHVVFETSNESVEVEVCTLDESLERCPQLMKIDVEGFESEVLLGANKIIENHQLKAVIIELNGSGQKYGVDQERIHNMFLKNGFMPCNYDPIKRKLLKIDTYENSKFNTIYIRDLQWIDERIRSSPKYRLWRLEF